MSRIAKWLYSIGFFLAMCGLLAAGTYQYKDNLSIPYNINLFTCGSASCTSMVLQNSAGTELFTGSNPASVLATIQNILVSPISVGISTGSSPLNVTGNLTASIGSPAAMNLVQVQNVIVASPSTYGAAPVGSVQGVNAFVTNSPTVVLSGSPVSVGIAAGSSPINVTGNLSTTSASPTTINLEQIQNVNVASPQTYGVAPVGSVQGVNAFVTNNVNVTPPTPLGVTLPASPLSVGITATPLQVTLPASPISVGIAGPTPLNVTLATGTNITQIAGNNIASPTGYGTAPVGSVQGVNAFVTNTVNTTPAVSPQNVTIAGPTPLNVTIGGTPLNVTLAGPTPLNMTLATGVNITQIAGNNIASPTGYGTAPVGSVQGVNAFITNAPSVTTTPAVSPQNVTLAGPTPLNVTIGGTPLNVTLAGPTPLNVTVGGITSPQNVTLAGPTPLNVTIAGSPANVTIGPSWIPTVLHITINATQASAVIATVRALGRANCIIGTAPTGVENKMAVLFFDSSTYANATPGAIKRVVPMFPGTATGNTVGESPPSGGDQYLNGLVVVAGVATNTYANANNVSGQAVTADCNLSYHN